MTISAAPTRSGSQGPSPSHRPDQVLELVLFGVREGKSADEIRREYGIDEQQYNELVGALSKMARRALLQVAASDIRVRPGSLGD